ncbi:sirohydrochlorin chelatase [Gordonia sinesedis]
MSESATCVGDVRLPAGDRLRDVTPILVAHGTRNPHGISVIAEIAAAVSARIGRTRTAFVDVLGPTPTEVIGDATRRPVLVPAFLAAGYHVRQDIPEHVRDAGRDDTIVTRALGPDPAIAAVTRTRLLDAGWRRGDAVVLAAAGSSDPIALDHVYRSARQLESLIGEPVEVGFIATATPTVPDAIARARRSGRRVIVASHLLAPGLFHDRLHEYGADAVSAPLGADPRIVDLIVTRMRAAVSPYRLGTTRAG